MAGWLLGRAQMALPLSECPSELRDCDLLFVTSPRANAITDVTEGYEGAAIDHVAIYYKSENGVGRVLEAVPDGGVRIDDLAAFLERSGEGEVLVGRVREPVSVGATLRKAFSYVGWPYDFLYLHDNAALYCSELVQFSYVDKDGRQVFPPVPMSFHDADGHVTSYWKAFYRRHGMEVPEGAPGSNPGELSRRSSVQMLFRVVR